MRVDEFIGLLADVRPRAGGFQARCPAHDDRTPSLSISEGEDGRILLKDHAGCTVDEIVQAIGLTTSDLFASDEYAPTQRRPEKTSSAPACPSPTPITSDVIRDLHRSLTATQRDHLRTYRLLADTVIDQYRLGFPAC